MKAVWAFDFDGVICDSVGESSLAAWKVGFMADDCFGAMSYRDIHERFDAEML